MHFTYLIQGKADNVARYLELNGSGSRLVGLTYDRPVDGFDFLPKSTYARGRNHLYDRVMKDPVKSDYYIFMDDDVVFQRGSFRQMERNLERYRPSVGVPIAPKMVTDTRGILFRNRLHPLVSRQRFWLNDEQYLALSRAVLEEGKLFPCTEEYETRSWFVASQIQQALIQLFYHSTSWQFNDCEIANDQHAVYPRELDKTRAMFEEYMSRHYPGVGDPRKQYRLALDLDEGLRHLPRNFARFVWGNARTAGAR